MPTFFDMALKLVLLLQQEFGAVFQVVKKMEFRKLFIKPLIDSTDYLSLVDASVICESFSKGCKAELINWFALQIFWLVSVWCGFLFGGTPRGVQRFHLNSGLGGFEWVHCKFCRNVRGCALLAGTSSRIICTGNWRVLRAV